MIDKFLENIGVFLFLFLIVYVVGNFIFFFLTGQYLTEQSGGMIISFTIVGALVTWFGIYVWDTK